MERAILRDARIVDENFDGAEVRFDLSNPSGAGFKIGDIPFINWNARICLERICGIVVTGIAGGDSVAFGLQRRTDRCADTPRSTGYNGHSRHKIIPLVDFQQLYCAVLILSLIHI